MSPWCPYKQGSTVLAGWYTDRHQSHLLIHSYLMTGCYTGEPQTWLSIRSLFHCFICSFIHISWLLHWQESGSPGSSVVTQTSSRCHLVVQWFIHALFPSVYSHVLVVRFTDKLKMSSDYPITHMCCFLHHSCVCWLLHRQAADITWLSSGTSMHCFIRAYPYTCILVVRFTDKLKMSSDYPIAHICVVSYVIHVFADCYTDELQKSPCYPVVHPCVDSYVYIHTNWLFVS